ncbi:MFS transporter [Streptomyces parvulus]|uniref:MFS transporter n=1 Tax=Streptomyces parvulus TaxID=146923 RepID=A0A369UTR6_9ACTN|nr:MFS transporter [Streptomyces parvulus]RDD83891.1 MFS transporter [Streptomyces parvulus]
MSEQPSRRAPAAAGSTPDSLPLGPDRDVDAPATPEPDSKRWWALVFISLAQLMVILDGTIVNIALPSAQRDLGISDSGRQWVITAYTLAFGGLLLLGGRVADLVGRKRTFLIGLLGFAAASALGGAALDPWMLFVARALQGLFGALLAPSALSLLTTTFTDPDERGKAFGIYGALAGGGSAFGLVVGGLLTEYLNWRWSLYVNVPIALAAFLGALAFLEHRPGQPGVRLDVPGALLGSGGLVALVYGFSEAEPRGWASPLVHALLAGGLVLLAGFTVRQKRAESPLLPLRILMDRNRMGSFATMGLATAGMFGVFLFLTYYLQVVLGYSPVKTGLAFLPMSVAIAVGATQIAARLLPRTAPRVLMASGMVLAAAGMVVLTGLSVYSGYATRVLPALLVLGLGMGLTFMPVYATATAGVAPKDSGITSATVTTFQQVGGSLGTVLLNTVAASAATRHANRSLGGPAQQDSAAESMVHGFTVASWWSAGVLLLAALVSACAVTARAPRRTHRETEA